MSNLDWLLIFLDIWVNFYVIAINNAILNYLVFDGKFLDLFDF